MWLESHTVQPASWWSSLFRSLALPWMSWCPPASPAPLSCCWEPRWPASQPPHAQSGLAGRGLAPHPGDVGGSGQEGCVDRRWTREPWDPACLRPCGLRPSTGGRWADTQLPPRGPLSARPPTWDEPKAGDPPRSVKIPRGLGAWCVTQRRRDSGKEGDRKSRQGSLSSPSHREGPGLPLSSRELPGM